MSLVFVDTAAWLALLNTSDQLHLAANGVMQRLIQQKNTLVTSEFVLLEVGDALAGIRLRQLVSTFVGNLSHNHSLEIIPLQTAILHQAWDLFAARPDKNWGITDCTSFIIMAQHHIEVAFTSDQHFVQAGFTKLL